MRHGNHTRKPIAMNTEQKYKHSDDFSERKVASFDPAHRASKIDSDMLQF